MNYSIVDNCSEKTELVINDERFALVQHKLMEGSEHIQSIVLNKREAMKLFNLLGQSFLKLGILTKFKGGNNGS